MTRLPAPPRRSRSMVRSWLTALTLSLVILGAAELLISWVGSFNR